tara:strand:- start:446 stop:718 length:273 start_codon:yes stop_codon:yes gene_type:complete
MTENSNTQNPKKTAQTQAVLDAEKTKNKIAAIDTDPRAGIQTCTKEEIDQEGQALQEAGVTAKSVDSKEISAPTASTQEQNRGQDQGQGR